MRDDYEKGLHDARLSIADFVLHIQRRLEDPAKSAYADNAAYWMAIVGGRSFATRRWPAFSRCPSLARPSPIRSRRSTDAVVGMGV
jgi:hypothetical protein